MPRPNPKDPSKGTGGSGSPGFVPPVIINPKPQPPTTGGDWFPKIPTWLNPIPPAHAEPTPPRIGTIAPAPQVCVEEDPMCGFREFLEGKPAGTYCKCANWFGWDGNGNGKERGCTECESCPPEKLAIGTCDCGVHCGVIPPGPTGPNGPNGPNGPKECPTCSQGYVSIGVHGSILDPCRCVKEEENPCTTPCKECDSAVCKECDAWDVPCERCRQKNGTCTTPADDCGCEFLDFGCKMGCWWEKYGTIVMIIGGLIGLGILLWLLRPLFSVIGSFKGGSP